MSSDKSNDYDKEQEKYLGPVNGYKLTYGSAVPNPNGLPTVGDSIRYTNQNGNPRFTNLGLVLGQITWSTGIFGTYNVPLGTANAIIPLTPISGGSNVCVLNPSSFLFSQPSNGILRMDDAFSWSFYVSVQLSAIVTGATNINLRLLKNGSPTNILLYKPSQSGAATDWGTFGLVDLNQNDTIQVAIQDTNSSNFTFQMVSFNVVLYAIRLLT